MIRMLEYIIGMKEFVNTLVMGAALVTGLVSLYQGVPLFALAKRVGFSILMFYLIGIALVLVWEAASVRGVNPQVSTMKEKEKGETGSVGE